MARMQVIINAGGNVLSGATPGSGKNRKGGETLGTSSSGDCVVEIDLAKFTYVYQLQAAFKDALFEFAGVLKS